MIIFDGIIPSSSILIHFISLFGAKGKVFGCNLSTGNKKSVRAKFLLFDTKYWEMLNLLNVSQNLKRFNCQLPEFQYFSKSTQLLIQNNILFCSQSSAICTLLYYYDSFCIATTHYIIHTLKISLCFTSVPNVPSNRSAGVNNLVSKHYC